MGAAASIGIMASSTGSTKQVTGLAEVHWALRYADKGAVMLRTHNFRYALGSAKAANRQLRPSA